MQKKMPYGAYINPNPLDFEKVQKFLLDEKAQKGNSFKYGISKERRRTWRRFEKTGKIKRIR